MNNSSLVDCVSISPNKSVPRNHKIDKITIHHMAGNLSVETCGNVFANPNRQASSNYGIGSDGRVGLYVEEKDRAWTSSNADNDNRAVTIEVANDELAPTWHVSDVALSKLIELCVDICKRNGIARLNFTGDASGNLTMHKYFASTSCPGPYLESKFPYIANEVNKRLGASVHVNTSSADIDDLARRVIRGDFGNGEARKQALGSNYNAVQARVNQILTGQASVAADIDDLARRTIRGEFGNGQARKQALGSNYEAVQKRVNEMLS